LPILERERPGGALLHHPTGSPPLNRLSPAIAPDGTLNGVTVHEAASWSFSDTSGNPRSVSRRGLNDSVRLPGALRSQVSSLPTQPPLGVIGRVALSRPISLDILRSRSRSSNLICVYVVSLWFISLSPCAYDRTISAPCDNDDAAARSMAILSTEVGRCSIPLADAMRGFSDVIPL
jgi:hypothetical protein